MFSLSPNVRFITLPIHLLAIYSFFTFDQLVAESFLGMFPVIWFLINGLGIAIGYHRLLSHNSFETYLPIRRALAFLGMLAGQGSPIFWVATHRGLHHPYSDGDRDPHTPKKGLWFSFLGWQLYFSEKDFKIKHAIDLMRDPWLKFMSLHYYKIYWAFSAFIAFVHLGFFFYVWIPMMIFAIHQENIVNCFCHIRRLGYRNFETSDNSVNIWWMGIIFWGQALHNNHHKYPKDYNYAKKWWEFDPSSMIVPLLIKRTWQAGSTRQQSQQSTNWNL